MVLHRNITTSLIHIPYQWVYADTTAREGAHGFVAADIGKFARQSDNNTLWMLIATTPTWIRINGTHASSHENGGNDEVGTGTPGAFAIPKADINGLLDSWVSSESLAAVPALRKLATGSTDACAGNDSRLSDARTPLSHAASHQSGADKVATASPGEGLIPEADDYGFLDSWVSSDSDASTPSLRKLGVGSTDACAGNDSRLSDSRTPVTHASSHQYNGSDEVALLEPRAYSIPQADASNKIDSWITADAAAGTTSLRKLGSGSAAACAGNDTRLSNSRTPLSHATSHKYGGSDPIGIGISNLWSDDYLITNVNITCTHNAAIAPDGTMTAVAMVPCVTLAEHYVGHYYTTLPNNQILKFEYCAKSVESDKYLWLYSFPSPINWAGAVFNLATGTIDNSSGLLSSSITLAENGYYRCIIVFNHQAQNWSCYCEVYQSAVPHTTFLGNGQTSFYLWGGKLHVLSPSIIPIVGSDTKLDNCITASGTAATPSFRRLGVLITSACAGNDSRLSDARTPTVHATTHKHSGGDEVATVTPANGAIPKAGADGKIAAGFIQLDHTTLSNIGTNAHSVIDNHISSTNGHSLTKAQVSLTSVTNDAQLKRGANDFSGFTEKILAVADDLVLVEDSASSNAKKRMKVGNLLGLNVLNPMDRRCYLFDDFICASEPSRIWTIFKSGATSAATLLPYPEGRIRLRAGTDSGDYSSIIIENYRYVIITDWNTITSNSFMTVRAYMDPGLGNATAYLCYIYANAGNRVMFVGASGANWIFRKIYSGATVDISTTVPVNTTWRTFKVQGSSTSIIGYIDDVSIGTFSTDLPAGGQVRMEIDSNATDALTKDLVIDSFQFGADRVP